MAPAISSVQLFRFGLFELDVAQGTLIRNGVRVKIQEQPYRVLILLLERAGETVTRDELRTKLWREGTFVDFDGSLNVILKKLRVVLDDNSDNPVFIETVPRRGYRFIAPVTAVNSKAAERHPSEPAEIASSGNAAAEMSGSSGRRRAHVTYLHAAGTLAVMCVIAVGMLAGHRMGRVGHVSSSGSRTSSHVPVRKSIAVLGFYNVNGNPADAWLGTAFTEMLSTELAAGEKLRLVAGEDIADLRLSSPWSPMDTLNRETSARIGTALSTNFLVLGSYTILRNSGRGQLRVDVRLQDAQSGEILTEIAETGSNQDLFPLVSRIGSSLRERLGVPGLADTDQAGILASLPMDAEAARFYALGVAKLRAFDILGAKDLLLQATEADPKFSLGHMMLARAWGQLGYEQKRRDEIKKALSLSQDLPRAERMLVEGDYQKSLGNHEKAASIYHALFELFPDSAEYGLTLAAEELVAGHRSQAAEAVRQVRRLPPPASEDPRIDLAEANVSTDRAAALALIRRAMDKASRQENKLLYAQARKEECLALLYEEKLEGAPASCQEAYNLFIAAGNRLGAADSLRLLADGLGTQGHLEQAVATYRQALAVLQGLGEHEKTGAILNNMAINLENEGKLDEAERLYREAKSNFEQAGDKANEATALGNIGDTSYLRGNLDAAAKSYQAALQIMATMDPGHPGYVLYRLADLKLTQGHVREAHQLAEQSLSELREKQDGLQYLTGGMLVMGETLEAEDDLDGARKRFEEALGIRKKIGATDLIAESQVEIAELLVEQGHPADAEPLLQGAIPIFEKDASDPEASSASLLLSRALDLEGKVEGARETLKRAALFARKNPDPALQLPITIQTALLNGAYPEKADKDHAVSLAEQQLRSAAATANKLGYYGLECKARLALGELEMQTRPSSGRALLATLASEAHGRGLELLARHAQEALSGGGNVVAENQTAR